MRKMFCIVNGRLEVNTYVIGDENGCYIIDPGFDGKRISSYVDRRYEKVLGILLTHGHFDHIGAVDELAKKYNCPVYLHPGDYELIQDDDLNYSKSFNYKIILRSPLTDIMELNDPNIEVLHTPGHSRGSVCIYFKEEKTLFSGDTLFERSIGRTDLYGSNQDDMAESLIDIFNTYEDDVKVYPGHDVMTTIGFEREHNPYI